MKLLLDANLSWRLTVKLKAYFSDCVHVEQVRSTPMKDLEIWRYALENNYMIITNDEDFLNLVNLKGFPPKVVLLRTGNQSNNYILQVLMSHKDDIVSFARGEQHGLLEIF